MNEIPKIRLNWYTNEEIFHILENINVQQLTHNVIKYPPNGSIFIYDKNKVKSFKKDAYTWKKRKVGGNSIREDRMSLKLNGVDCIYGCYSHNALIPAFHRRCYWLLNKSEYVLVHYLIKFNDSNNKTSSLNQCLAFGTSSLSSNNSDLCIKDIFNELSSILYPYSLNSESNRKLVENFARNLFDKKNFIINIEVEQSVLSVGKEETHEFIELDTLKISPNDMDTSLSLNTCTNDDLSLFKTNITRFTIVSKQTLFNDSNFYTLKNVNDQNVCLPLKFINGHTLELSILPIKTNVNSSFYLFENTCMMTSRAFAISFDADNVYKMKFFLIERFLFINNLLKSINGNQNFDYFKELSFEDSICNFMNMIANDFHHICNQTSTNLSSDFYLSNHHEGKTIAHLIVLLDNQKLFHCFCDLFKFLQSLPNLNYLNDFLMMLKNEVDLSFVDVYGYTPLMYACLHGYKDTAIALYNLNKKSLHICNKLTNQGPIEIAQQNGHIELANELQHMEKNCTDDLSWLNELDSLKPLEAVETHEQKNVYLTENSHNELLFLCDSILPSENELVQQVTHPQTPSNTTTYKAYNTQDDQDKKIKTLADNIIAAIPSKIKSSIFTDQTQEQSNLILDTINVSTLVSKRSDFRNQSSLISSDAYSSSLSPINSPTNDFQIDSPPSTAEFCQYFHKTSFESDFSQLKLSDHEQRELYEAALVIQNAYRRYLKRKKLRDTHQQVDDFILNSDDCLLQSNTQTSTLTLNDTKSSLKDNCFIEFEKQTLDDEHEDHDYDPRQYHAACIIQKYFRRYKEYENLKKYNEAAAKIQSRYRAYKNLKSQESSLNEYDTSSVNHFTHHYHKKPKNEMKSLQRSYYQRNNNNNKIPLITTKSVWTSEQAENSNADSFDDETATINSYSSRETAIGTASFVFVFMYGSSLLTNFMVLRVFFRNKKLIKPVNFFTIIIAFLNLFSTLVHMPLLVIGISINGIPFGHIGCQIQGFLFVFIANFTLHLLMIISLERYWIVASPYEFHKLTFKACFKIVGASFTLCFIWSFLPLLGWSKYGVEVNGLFCSMEFKEHSWSVISFYLAGIILFWTIPLIAIIYTNVRLFHILQIKTANLSYGYWEKNNKLTKRKRNQLIVIILLSACYIISWTPYVALLVYGIFFPIGKLPFGLTILPMIASKSTNLWCPILEMLFNSSVRKNLLFIRDAKEDRVISTHENNKNNILVEGNKRLQDSDECIGVYGFRHMDSKVVDFYDMDFKQLRELEILC